MPNDAQMAKDADALLNDLKAYSNLGFVSGYFRIDRSFETSALPSVRLRRSNHDYEAHNRSSLESYDAVDRRQEYIRQLVQHLERIEESCRQNFVQKYKRGTDAFFATITLMFLLAIGATLLFEDDVEGGTAALNILMAFPFLYIPAYIFMRIRVKKIYEKAVSAKDLSWVFSR